MGGIFDFISNEAFAENLVSDYSEMEKCLNNECWKSALVLSGSIIEAMIIDHLIETNHEQSTGNDPLKFTLGQALDAAKQQKIISEKAHKLATVIKDYRNLIHAGRVIRINENVDEENANIAKSLVDLLIREIGTARKKEAGYTSAQLISKLIADPGAANTIKHLVNDMRSGEIEKFLLYSAFDQYQKYDADEYVDHDSWMYASRRMEAFKSSYHSLLSTASDELIGKVSKNYMKLLREGSERIIECYDHNFFNGIILNKLSSGEKSFCVERLIICIKKDLTLNLFERAKDIHVHLDTNNRIDFLDPLIKYILTKSTDKSDVLRKEIMQFISWEMSCNKHKDDVVERLEQWQKQQRDETRAAALSDVIETRKFFS